LFQSTAADKLGKIIKTGKEAIFKPTKMRIWKKKTLPDFKDSLRFWREESSNIINWWG
jgi:hypothetical protein